MAAARPDRHRRSACRHSDRICRPFLRTAPEALSGAPQAGSAAPKLSQRLELALDASRIGVWEQDLDNQRESSGTTASTKSTAPRKTRAANLSGLGRRHPPRRPGNGPERLPTARYRRGPPLFLLRSIASSASTGRSWLYAPMPPSFRDPEDTPKMIGAEMGRYRRTCRAQQGPGEGENPRRGTNSRAETVKARIEHNSLGRSR